MRDQSIISDITPQFVRQGGAKIRHDQTQSSTGNAAMRQQSHHIWMIHGSHDPGFKRELLSPDRRRTGTGTFGQRSLWIKKLHTDHLARHLVHRREEGCPVRIQNSIADLIGGNVFQIMPLWCGRLRDYAKRPDTGLGRQCLLSADNGITTRSCRHPRTSVRYHQTR